MLLGSQPDSRQPWSCPHQSEKKLGKWLGIQRLCGSWQGTVDQENCVALQRNTTTVRDHTLSVGDENHLSKYFSKRLPRLSLPLILRLRKHHKPIVTVRDCFMRVTDFKFTSLTVASACNCASHASKFHRLPSSLQKTHVSSS